MNENERDNCGSLSRNESKNEPGGNKNWPDFRGSLRVDGVDFWLSGWLKDGKHGKFLSLSLKRKEEGTPRAAAAKLSDADFPF